MPKKSKEVKTKINKKYLAIGIAIIVIISAFALSFYSKEIIERLANENGEEEKLPFYDSEFGNKRITNGEDANMESSVAVNPKDENNIVAVGKDYNTASGDTWIGYYSSSDGGKSWTEKLIENNILNAYYKAGDPIIDTDKDGNFYLTFKTEGKSDELIGFQKLTGVFVMKSTDKGNSFSEIATVVVSPDATTIHSKPYISVDKNTGIVYVVWIAFNFNSNSQIWFAKSINNGETFIGHKVLSDIFSTDKEYPGVVIKAVNDKIHVSWIDTKNKELWYAHSENRGDAFSLIKISTIEPIPSPLPNGNFRTPTMPSLTIFKDTIYIAWNDYKNGDADIFIVSSKDGNTWSNASRVNKDELKNKKDQFFPSLASNSKYLQLIFYDRREADNIPIKVYYAYSKDGINFAEFSLSDKDFNGDLSKSGTDNKERIGDYIGLTTTEKFAIGVWCDTRDSSVENHNTNLYCAKVGFE